MRVFPTRASNKAPYISGWQDSATEDQAQFDAWNKQYPGCMWGTPTGREDGLLVIDVDVKNGKDGLGTLRRLEEELGALPLTYRVRTPSGGLHYYFQYPVLPDGAEVKNSVETALGSGIDIRANGGLVIVVGSVNADGLEYALEAYEPLAELPDAWVDRLVQPSFAGTTRDRENKMADVIMALAPFREWLEIDGIQGNKASVKCPFHEDTHPSAVIYSGGNFSCSSCPVRHSNLDSLLDALFLRFVGPTRASAVQQSDEEGVASSEDDNAVELSKADALVAFLSGRIRRTASFEEIRARLKISKSRLSNLIKEDKSTCNRLRRFSEGGCTMLALREAAGLVRLEPADFNEKLDRFDAAYLPEGLHSFIAPAAKGLHPRSFVLISAPGDGGKSEFLLNCAIVNAMKGKRVALVDHEGNNEQFQIQCARRIAGAYLSIKDAHTLLAGTSWFKNITYWHAPGIVTLEEFLEQLLEIKPEIVVYDYLNQSFINAYHRDQTSVFATIVQRIGQEVVSKGIPFFTAVQPNREGKEFFIKDTWCQRATLALEVRKREKTQSFSRLSIRIVKNKHGYDQNGTNDLVMAICNSTGMPSAVFAESAGAGEEPRGVNSTVPPLPMGDTMSSQF